MAFFWGSSKKKKRCFSLCLCGSVSLALPLQKETRSKASSALSPWAPSWVAAPLLLSGPCCRSRKRRRRRKRRRLPKCTSPSSAAQGAQILLVKNATQCCLKGGEGRRVFLKGEKGRFECCAKFSLSLSPSLRVASIFVFHAAHQQKPTLALSRA